MKEGKEGGQLCCRCEEIRKKKKEKKTKRQPKITSKKYTLFFSVQVFVFFSRVMGKKRGQNPTYHFF